MDIERELFLLQDLKYREFQSNLMPTVDKNQIIGVRIPDLRKLAVRIYKEGNYEDFLQELPHRYYEENNLHGFIISEIKDITRVLEYTKDYLPYIDNWATCDSYKPKVFKKYPDILYNEILKWIESDHLYTVRFAVVSLLTYFLDYNFKPGHLILVENIKNDEYYINMAIAWYYSFALIKQYEETIDLFENPRLEKWIHNKSLQKAIESRRVEEDRKKYLKSLKIR